MKNNIALGFAYLLIMLTGYMIGGALYANLIFITPLETSYYTFIPWQLMAVIVALKYKKEIIAKFKSKKRKSL